MPPESTELLLVLPHFALGDLARFGAWVVVAVILPGMALRRLLELRPSSVVERGALACVLGVLATSLLYYVLALFGLQRFHPPIVVILAVVASGFLAVDLRRPNRRVFRAWDAATAVGLMLIAAMAAVHLAQVASLVEFDATGARLYGAMFSDKMTNMSPCAALIEGVPPAALRMSGTVFPSHYFPHLFVAAADRAVGVDYVDGFWFYAAALGIVIQSLAVLAFCRRFVRSRWLSSVALLLFALARFTTELKPLDLSLALLLLAILAIDRHGSSGRRRWAALAVLLAAAMPLYEVFTAAAALGGLALWAVAPAASWIWRRPSLDKAILPVSRRLAMRLPIAVLACGGAYLSVQLVYVGAEVKSPPELIARNSYRDSYKHEWIDFLRDSRGSSPAVETVYRWKRGKAEPDRPTALQHAAGEIVYNLGFLVYFLARFVNVALFGVVAVWTTWKRQPHRWSSGWAVIAAIALFGFGAPWAISWGNTAGGRWYETPNIYRLTDCAYVLLLLVGAPVLIRAMVEARRPRWWIPLGLALWQLWLMVSAAIGPATAYHHVDCDRLGALAYLRGAVPPGDVVLHPWTHDLIRDARRPEEVAWVYKRHFTLGSNLAGRRMYYEGREDHLFINGAVTADEVFRRRDLREAFYTSAAPDVLREVVEVGGVRWVVADADHPAPSAVSDHWPRVFTSDGVTIYRRE